MELHPLNREFEWRDREGPFRAVTPEQARAFDRDGFFLWERALEPERLTAVREAVDELEAREEQLVHEAGGRLGISRADEITFAPHLVKRSPSLRTFASSNPFVDLCRDLLGPRVRLYWDQAVYKAPEAPRPFPWHQDTAYNFTEPQDYLTLWIPLVDATVENGCPWIAPGLHRHGTLHHRNTPLGLVCKEDDEGAVAVEAKVGDVVVFSSLTPHRTGPNTSGEVRKAYILQYAVDGTLWLPSGQACDDPEKQFLVTQISASRHA